VLFLPFAWRAIMTNIFNMTCRPKQSPRSLLIVSFSNSPKLLHFLSPWTACVVIRSNFFAFANLVFTENKKLKNKQEMLCTLVIFDITIKFVLLRRRIDVKVIQFRRFSSYHRFSAAPACVANKHYAALGLQPKISVKFWSNILQDGL